MIGETWHVALAGAFLLASHFGLSSTALRARIAGRIGETAFLGLYSLVAAAAIAWLTIAYARAPYGPVLWWLYPIGHYAAVVIMPIALLLVVCGYSQPNPTAIGQPQEYEARGILRVTRHPVMWGIALWALAHLLANGDLASFYLFASLAILALGGTLAIDAKKDRKLGVTYEMFRQQTSNVPFLAIARGRQSAAAAVQELGLVRLLIVIVAYGALLHLHTWLFGVPPYPV
ncbi:MAG: NnrU family protein [Azospirillaceae bacterium]